MNKHDRRFAERTRQTLHEGSAAAEESTHAIGNGYFAAAEAVRDFNMKLIEMAQNNMMATLNFAQKVATAKSPPEAAALWSSCARESFERWTDQSTELAALAQRVAQVPGR
jgi:hypothetical protein